MNPRLAVVLAAALPSWPHAAAAEPTSEAVRQEVERVYARSEFQPREDVVLNSVLRWLKAFFHWLGGLHASSPALYWVLLVSLIGLLALLIGHIVYIVMSGIRLGSAAASAAAGRNAARQRLSSRHREDADRHASAGEYTQAVRSLFLSLVYAFDEAGKLPFQPSSTNHEYLEFFADRPAVRTKLNVFVDLLDDNWYGQRQTSEGQYRECLSHYDDVRSQRA